MDTEVVRLIAGAISAVLAGGGIVAGAFKLIENRKRDRRTDHIATMAELGDFRAAAEAHILAYDVPMRAAVLDLRYEVNQLHARLSEPPRVWPDLPKVTPLFPDKDGKT